MSHTECFIDGVWYPSVTTIMHAEPKPWLDNWREKWGTRAIRKTEIAAAIGTAFHDCIEQYLNTGRFTVKMEKYSSCIPRISGMMESWIDWVLSVDGIIFFTEMKVISYLYRFSGTLDFIGEINGVFCVVDWKTSARIYPEMAVQLSAYAQAYAEMQNSKPKTGLIVHISKDKPHYKLTTKEFKLSKRIFSKFLKLREMFDEIENRKTNDGGLDA